MQRRQTILVGLAGAIITASVPAHADALEVEWNAPPECPAAAAVEAALVARLGAAEPESELVMSARVQAVPGGYSVALHASAGGLVRERALTAEHCAELADAAVLIAALVADLAPGAAPDRAAESTAIEQDAPAGQLASPLAAYAHVHWLSDAGSIPGIGFGPGITFGFASGALRVEAGAAYLLPRTVYAAHPTRPVAQLRVLTTALGTSYQLFTTSAFALGPCARAEYGRIFGRSENVAMPARADAPWAIGFLGLHVELALSDAMLATITGLAGMPLDRVQFAIDGIGRIHELPAVLGRVHAGLEWRP